MLTTSIQVLKEEVDLALRMFNISDSLCNGADGADSAADDYSNDLCFTLSYQVILARTLTGVQGDIRCKVLAVLTVLLMIIVTTYVSSVLLGDFGGNAHRGTK